MADWDQKDVELRIRTIVGKMPFCGCGDPTLMWKIVLAMLERIETSVKSGYYDETGRPRNPPLPSCYDPMPEYDLSGNAVQFVAHVLNNANLTEHGTSVGFGWLTAPGALILRFLRKYKDVDNDKWPEYADSADSADDFRMSDEAWRKFEDDTRDEADAVDIPDGEPRRH
jgi:hypothetical protein